MSQQPPYGPPPGSSPPPQWQNQQPYSQSPPLPQQGPPGSAPVTPRKRRGCLKSFATLAGVLLLVIIIVVIYNSSGKKSATATPVKTTTSAVTSVPAGSAPTTVSTSAPASTTAVTPVVTGAKASPQTSATTAATANPSASSQGIAFGKPVALGSGSVNLVAVLATNTTDQVKTFTVKATYKTGNQITATAVGAVNDLLPQQIRAVTLTSQSAIPTTFDSVRVDVDTLVQSAKSTTGAEVASKQAFGKPAVRTNGGLTTVDVEVTNNDSKPHSYTVQAAFMKGGELVGVATGAVNDI